MITIPGKTISQSGEFGLAQAFRQQRAPQSCEPGRRLLPLPMNEELNNLITALRENTSRSTVKCWP